jgi:hypothetical protein
MSVPTEVRDYGPNRLTPDADREFCSHECRAAGHRLCDGYYDTHGSALGYDTFRCLCACHDGRAAA